MLTVSDGASVECRDHNESFMTHSVHTTGMSEMEPDESTRHNLVLVVHEHPARKEADRAVYVARANQ